MKSLLHPNMNEVPKNITDEPANGQAHLPAPELFPVMEPPELYHRRGVNWRIIIWGLFITL
ncbi:MAG TPA: hypothetical protein VEC96_00590, partial [Anaerolineae bacterium]|nr:hypothetical protein [Anaerolineae bacterium]